MVLYRCDDTKDNLVAMRGCVIIIPFGWDLMAVTSSAGRQMSASYALLWEVFQRCQEARVTRYDMMGVDPRHNPGSYHLKKGTGTEFVDYLGEWEWASYPPLRWCANGMLR
jgi:lipid II:glycine glycyltransferase (peptidoglycan interpeptide bridge formation enzyme)